MGGSMKKYLFALLLTISFTSNAFAQETLSDLKLDELYDIASNFAECSGTFDAYSEWLKPLYPSAAENYKGLQRGALMASTLLFAMDHQAKQKKIPADFNFHQTRAENIAYGVNIKVKSLMEIDDIKSANVELQKCIDLNKLQAAIIRELRK